MFLNCSMTINCAFNTVRSIVRTHGQLWRLGVLLAEQVQYLVLQLPKCVVSYTLGLEVLSDRYVHNGACRGARRQQQGRELDQVCAFSDEDLDLQAREVKYGGLKEQKINIQPSQHLWRVSI